MTNNQLALCAFVMNTAYNMFTDESKDTFFRKLGKAALGSIPSTLTIDTTGMVQHTANKYNLGEINQPKTTIHSIHAVLNGSSKAIKEYAEQNNMVAYYNTPDTSYKNLE